MKQQVKKKIPRDALLAAAILITLLIATTIIAKLLEPNRGHSTSPISLANSYKIADMSGYRNLSKTTDLFYEMEALDVVKEIDAGSTFVVVFSHEECPLCSVAIPVLNEVASEYGWPVGYVNTRKNPEWRSNMAMDHYDELADHIGEYFQTDEMNRQHLYVPQIFFIQNGEVTYTYEGAGPTYDGSGNPLTPEQKNRLSEAYRKGFETKKTDLSVTQGLENQKAG